MIALPLIAADPGSPFGGVPTKMPVDGARAVLEGRRVLLVEDEVFIAVDIREALEAGGAEVVFARNLSQAMDAVARDAFDAAILDVTLGANETCRPVADRLRALGTPFVLHSGDLDRQGEVIGTLDAPVVAKPAPPDAVVARLVRLLGDGGAPQTVC